MSTNIHPSSVVSDKAVIGANVSIGPFCFVEDDVEIGDGTELVSHVTLRPGSRIGKEVKIHPGATIGSEPQDLKFVGEETTAVVGDRTVIRECATVNRGTTALGTTKVGSDCLIMAYSHVAHDCIVGDHVILANSVNLSGHVEVHDWAIIGGVTGVHQFVRVGPHSMTAGCSRVVQDVPAFSLVAREPLVYENLNVIGLRRRGFSNDQIKEIDEFYNSFYRGGLNTSQALESYLAEHPTPGEHVMTAIEFIKGSNRGMCRAYATNDK